MTPKQRRTADIADALRAFLTRDGEEQATPELTFKRVVSGRFSALLWSLAASPSEQGADLWFDGKKCFSIRFADPAQGDRLVSFRRGEWEAEFLSLMGAATVPSVAASATVH